MYCVPVINLFEHDAIPLNFDGKKDLYPVIPAGFNREHFEIFDIKRVSGSKFLKETGNRIYTYPKFESFVHSSASGRYGYYKSIIKNNIEETGYDHFVSFVSDSNKI